MTTQQEPRIVAPGKPKIGARPQPTPEPEPAGDGGGKGGGKKRLISILLGVGIVLAAVAAYWFLMGPGSAPAEDAADGHGDAAAEEAHEEVESAGVQVIESISINLAGGHYLRLGLGLDISAEGGGGHGGGELGEAKALDAAIALFSGQTIEDLEDVAYREELKGELLHSLEEAYHGEVIGVYYTDFVTQ